MPRINLLPWREELREQRQQDFVLAIAMSVLVTCFLFLIAYWHIERLKEYQQNRNSILEKEMQIVDRKIKDINGIDQKKNKLLAKVNLIQTLQESRPHIVHLFAELAKITTEGIFLSQFKQSGKNLTFIGKAQSNARVSAYMRGIEASPWLTSPDLKIIQGEGKATKGVLSDFTINAMQKSGGGKSK